ncbi:MAG: hypothetical protein WBB40_02345 [Psychrobacter alimentarius]
MVLDYLSIKQTLIYLEKETGYKYEFDELKELSLAGKLDVFFYYNCIIYNIYGSDVSPTFVKKVNEFISQPLYLANNVHKIGGMFFLKDAFLNIEDNNFSKLKEKVTVEEVYEQQDFSFDKESNYSYSKGDTGYLSSAEFGNLHYFPDGRIDSKPLQDKAIIHISYDELRFKKKQLDKLVNIPEASALKIEDELAKVRDELKVAYSNIEKRQEKIDRLEAQEIQLDDNELSERSEKNYLITIGLLLNMLTTPRTVGGKSTYSSEALIIEKISREDIYGQKKSTIGERFKKAKDVLIDEKKKKEQYR